MGYKRKDLQILGGGLNLLPPGDKVPQTDYLVAENWRVDKVGKLVSRFGYSQKFSIAAAGLAHSGFVNGGINGDYYVGCNASITGPSGAAYVTNPSKLYWNFGGTAIATGFDGGRIGLACMNGWVYFMNRGNQGRHQSSLGATSQTWNLAMPANSPTAAAAGGPGTSASVTYHYRSQSNSAFVHYLNIAGNVYQFTENGYSDAQISLVIASLAVSDPNCTVTYDGTPADGVVITPIVANTLIQVSGSSSGSGGAANAAINLANGAVTSLPNGTYQFYMTYESSDETLESNPSPVSNPVALASSAVTLTNLVVSPDARVGVRNIYAIGGTLAQPYLVTKIGDNTSTSWTFSFSDLSATNSGIVMPTDHDAPPAASGLIGPHFNRLFAWSTSGNPNRLFYTEPGLPQYWPGSADPAVGNWVDVGAEGEAIVWCTLHGNILVIYKERSIWKLVGPPDTGYLEQVTDAMGLCGAFAVVAAGTIDYFVGPGGLKRFDMDRVEDGGAAIQPLFQLGTASAGSYGYGSIMPGTAYNTNSIYPYAVALGYGMGKLYMGYSENPATGYRTMVYHEESKRWFSHNNVVSGATGFFGFVFDGAVMCGLTGSAGGAALGLSLDDFRSAGTVDSGSAVIVCVYHSHYEDGGLPDNQKRWLELVVDYELAGDTAPVTVLYDNGANLNPAAYAGGTTYAMSQWVTSGGLVYQSLQGGNVGHTPASSPTWWLAVPFSPATLSGSGRRQTSITLGTDGVLAKNIAVVIGVNASHLVILHNVYLYYYEEARLALAASSLPTDLGVGKVKQCKELELDIEATGGNVAVNIYSDLPGNALAVRQTPTVTANSGRAVMKYPFSTAGPPPSYTEGYLWRLALTAAAAAAPFRLYAARLLMRVVGVYVEAYEAAAGFVWDSMELSFESAITKIPRTFAIALAANPIKQFREISFEIETFNSNVTLSFLSDLPGNAQAVRHTTTINTGTAGRRFYRVMLPLPSANPAAYAGGTTYALADQVTSAGVVYQSLQAANTGHTPASSPTWWVALPIEGRMCRIQLSGTSKFILYEAGVELLPVGVYVEAYEAAAGAVFDSREQDWGSPQVKEARELELDIDVTNGSMTAQLLSDIAWAANVETPGAMATRITSAAIATTGRQKVLVPLTVNAALEQFLEGRLLRLILSGTLAFRLYGARLKVRPIGTFVDVNEAAGGALWDSTDLDLGSPTVKQLRALELDLWAYGTCTVKVYTDLPGNVMTLQATKTTPATIGRTKIQIPLAQGAVPDNYIFGRLVRVTITSASAFKLFGARIHARPIGVYAETYEAAAGATWDSMAQDLGNPNDKYFDQVRFEMDSDGAASVAIYTDLPGESMALRASKALTGGATSRHWATAPLAPTAALPFTVEGRSIRTVVSSAAGFRLYRAQVRSCRIGRYLAAVTPSAAQDSFNTLEFDFASGKIKNHKRVEIDLAADGTVTLAVFTEQNGALAQVWSTTVTTPNGRMTFRIPLPPGIRGELLRISLTSPAAARVFRLRTWSRSVNEADAQWAWVEYPLESSDAVPAWTDLPLPQTPPDFAWAELPVEPTKPEWTWAALPVNPTPPGTSGEPAQWIWGKVLSVEDTPDVWQWVDVPFEVTG